MKKPRIGIDLDDTLIEFVGGFSEYHNRTHGSDLERSHFTTWEMHKAMGCTKEEATRRVIEFYHSDDHLLIEAVPGARVALLELAHHYELHLVTARSPSRMTHALYLVNRHFGELFTEHHFIGHERPKGEHCAELNIKFFVDDGLHNAHSIAMKGTPVYLMDRPWNQGPLPPLTTRVKGWSDILHLDWLTRNPS